MKLINAATVALIFAVATVQAAATLTPDPDAAGHNDVADFDDLKDPSPADRGDHHCRYDKECGHGYYCKNRQCREKHDDYYCRYDKDCRHGYYCRNDRCRPKHWH